MKSLTYLMRPTVLVLLVLVSLLVLSSCSFTVHRELKHQYFTMQYPNWENYTLEKYADKTFKIITSDKQNTCEVLVVAYETDYLEIASVILTTIGADVKHTLLEKHLTSSSAAITYTSSGPPVQTKTHIIQCGLYAYVVKYACSQDVYSEREETINTVMRSVTCGLAYGQLSTLSS